VGGGKWDRRENKVKMFRWGGISLSRKGLGCGGRGGYHLMGGGKGEGKKSQVHKKVRKKKNVQDN